MKTKMTKFVALVVALCLVMTICLAACNNAHTTHVDEDNDNICDVCGEEIVHKTHIDTDNDGKCDVCGESMHTTHVDENRDDVCDVCGEKLAHVTHYDANGDYICDICKEILEHNHVDANKDAKCDVCGILMDHDHVDSDGDGICDLCQVRTGEVEVVVSASAETVEAGGSVTLTATVKNAEDKSVTWSVSDETLVKVENNTLTVIGSVVIDAYVFVTATSVQDSAHSASMGIVVKAARKEGEVGHLTSDMLKQIGNASVTVDGVVSDYYIDNLDYNNNSQTDYSFTVKMTENNWYGSWKAAGSDSVLSNHYSKGTEKVNSLTTDSNGHDIAIPGYALQESYITKDNTVGTRTITDYRSVPSLWENQHLWNHLDQLDIDLFDYDRTQSEELSGSTTDITKEVYKYNYSSSDSEQLYLMTYIAVSLTPMLTGDDTFEDFYIVLEKDSAGNYYVSQIRAKTFTTVYPEDDEEPDWISFTEVVFELSNLGSTEIEEIAAYEAEEQTSSLQMALNNMKNAASYTFTSTENQVQGVSSDSSDYEVDYSSSSTTAVRGKIPSNSTTASGTVGLVGYVTSDAILLAKTSKYEYTMDGKAYKTEYYGYKKTAENLYDYFTYDTTAKNYVGKTKYVGTVMDQMPEFDLSANIFTYVGTGTNGSMKFELRDYGAARDIAMQLGLYNADYCEQISYSDTKFTVEIKDGYVTKVTYPYNINDNYLGVVTVNYSNVNSTEMIKDVDVDDHGKVTAERDIFANYVERVVPTAWSQVKVKYYYPDLTNLSTWNNDTGADVVFAGIYKDAFNDTTFPSYTSFFNVFGDLMYGPFYELTEVLDSAGNEITDADGNKVYKTWIQINTEAQEYDENYQITKAQFDAYCEKLAEELQQYGFSTDYVNTDTSGGETGYGDRNYVLVSDTLQIRLWNNGTKNFTIYIYNAGDYKKA